MSIGGTAGNVGAEAALLRGDTGGGPPREDGPERGAATSGRVAFGSALRSPEFLQVSKEVAAYVRWEGSYSRAAERLFVQG